MRLCCALAWPVVRLRAIVLRSCVAGRAWPRLRAIVLRSCVAGRAWPRLRAIVLRSCAAGRAWPYKVACDCASLLRGRSCVAAWFVVFVLHSCACAGIILDTSHVPELGRAIVLRSCVAGRAWPRLRAIVLRSCVAGRAWPYEVACDCAALLRGRSCVAACCVAGVSSLHSCACAVILYHMIFKQCARARAWAWTRCCGGSGCFPAPSGCSTGARLLFRRAAFRGVPAVFFCRRGRGTTSGHGSLSPYQ